MAIRSRLGRVALLALLVVPPAFGAIAVKVLPTTQNALSGGTVSVQLAISGLGVASAPSLGAFDVNVGFDPTLLQFVNASYGDPTLGDQLNLSHFGNVTNTTPGAGTVDLFELSLDAISTLNNLQAAGFVLVTVTFQVIGTTGSSALNLSINALSDASGNSLTALTQNGNVLVGQSGTPPTSIPTLSTPGMMTFGTLLMAIGTMMQRKGREVEGVRFNVLLPFARRSPLRSMRLQGIPNREKRHALR